MSEKRFVKDHSYLVNYDKYCILDKVQHKHLYLDEVCEKLNEQQTTIEKLEKENEQLRKDKEQIKEKSTKNEELIQRKLTNVLLARIYVAQLSLNPNLPYVEQSLKKEMQILDKKIRELCGDVFNE